MKGSKMELKCLLFFVFITAISCLRSHMDTGYSFKSQRLIKKEQRNKQRTTKLYETIATGTQLSIEPTVYQDDLYGVLGLQLNATKVQLRDAYWAIAFRTHPDRNDTPEALSDFRNASHAYKVLGRSEKTRSEYDSKYRTKLAIESMDQISRDVIAPFAMDVAIPLIDLTVRGIGSFAVPFFKDAYEQSSSVFRAAFQNDESLIDEDTEPTGFEAITRAANAAMRTGLEQRIRRTKDSIGSTSDRLVTTATQLKEAIEKESTTLKSLEELKIIDERSQISLVDITRDAETAREQLKNAELQEQRKEEEFLRTTASISLLLESAAALSLTRSTEEEEISRLEAALTLAKEKNRSTLIRQTTLEINISAEKRAIEVLEGNFMSATKEKAALLTLYSAIEKNVLDITLKTAKASNDKIEFAAEAEKQKYVRSSLERKGTQLGVKKTELQNTLKVLETEWNLKEGEAAFEKNRILTKRKDAEDKIIENKRIAKDLAEIAEMELSIRRREKEVEEMEQERSLLVKQEAIERELTREKEILDILERSNEITATNLKNGVPSPTTQPPHQRLNPFSRRDKYEKNKNSLIEQPQKLEILEEKKKWAAQRITEDLLNFDDFYTI